MRLETGAITDEQFDAREAQILDRLDELQDAMAHAHDQRVETEAEDSLKNGLTETKHAEAWDEGDVQ